MLFGRFRDLSHQGRPEKAERHHKDEGRHQIHQWDRFDLGHSEASRHRQDTAAGREICEHGRGQHTGQQLTGTKDDEQDDDLRNGDRTDGRTQRRSEDHCGEEVQHRFRHQ